MLLVMLPLEKFANISGHANNLFLDIYHNDIELVFFNMMILRNLWTDQKEFH